MVLKTDYERTAKQGKQKLKCVVINDLWFVDVFS
jgi:hypothetical protein